MIPEIGIVNQLEMNLIGTLNRWYTLRVEWKNKNFKVYIDGVEKWGTSGPNDYAPKVHRIWIGCAPGRIETGKYTALEPNLTFRNVKLVCQSDSCETETTPQYSLNISAENGSVSTNPSGSVFEEGTTVTLTATADQGYLFNGWSGDASGSDASVEITMDADKTVIANFIIDPNAPRITLSGSPFDFTFDDISSKQLTIESNVDWTLTKSDDWITVSSTSGSNNGTVDISVTNNGGSFRSGSVTVSGEGISKNISITQQSEAGGVEIANRNSSMSTNLAGITPFAPEWTFQNLVKQGLKWVAINQTDYWNAQQDRSSQIDQGKFSLAHEGKLDDNGYPKAGVTGKMAVIWDSQLDCQGRYICTFDGTAELEFFSDPGFNNTISTVTKVDNNRYIIDLPTSGGTYFLGVQINSNSETTPLTNLKIVEERFDGSSDIFYPEFLENWKYFKNFRFMDWMETNNSDIVTWEEYPAQDHCIYTDHVPFETMIALSNLTQADPWFCVPHQANNDFITNMATLIKDEVASNLTVYVEYSNEVWNGGFDQSDYAKDLGNSLRQGGESEQVGGMRFLQEEVQKFIKNLLMFLVQKPIDW